MLPWGGTYFFSRFGGHLFDALGGHNCLILGGGTLVCCLGGALALVGCRGSGALSVGVGGCLFNALAVGHALAWSSAALNVRHLMIAKRWGAVFWEWRGVGARSLASRPSVRARQRRRGARSKRRGARQGQELHTGKGKKKKKKKKKSVCAYHNRSRKSVCALTCLSPQHPHPPHLPARPPPLPAGLRL